MQQPKKVVTAYCQQKESNKTSRRVSPEMELIYLDYIRYNLFHTVAPVS